MRGVKYSIQVMLKRYVSLWNLAKNSSVLFGTWITLLPRGNRVIHEEICCYFVSFESLYCTHSSKGFILELGVSNF